MKKIFLSLLTIFMVLSLSVVLVKASESTTVSLEDGVQIRTDGNNGLRWVANVTNHKEGNEYGFLFAQGDLAEVTIETNGVVNKVVEGVTDEELTMAATMVNFPKSAATQDISVVAYVKVGDVYSYSNVVVRNLSEVAVQAYEKGIVTGDFVEAVYDASVTTFNTNGGYLTGEYDFVISRYNYNKWADENYPVGMDPTGEYLCTSSGSTWYRLFLKETSTGSGIYKIVAAGHALDSSTAEYDYLLGTTTQGVYDKTSIDTVVKLAKLENATDYYIKFLDSIPTASTNYCSIRAMVSDDFEYISTSSDHLGGGETLPTAKRDYYDFNGWSSKEDCSDTPVLKQGSNRTLYANWTPTNYTLQYELGEGTCSATLVNSYNYESDEIILPTESDLKIDGGKFGGWYDNAACTGTSITSIPAKSHGNLTLYALWVMDAPTEYNISDTDKVIIEKYSPNYFVSSSFAVGKFIINGTTYEAGVNLFNTISSALAKCTGNEKIYVFSGSYNESVNLNVNGVSLLGANADVDPNTGARQNESYIEKLTVSANSVTFNGFTLVDQLQSTTESVLISAGISDCILAYSTIAKQSKFNSNANGLFKCLGTKGKEVNNLTIQNFKVEQSSLRPTLFYGYGINNFTVKDSVFLGSSTPSYYTDAVKIISSSYGNYGLNGNVTFTGNTFKDYGQYLLWFANCGNLTLNVSANKFINCGQTAGNHGALYIAGIASSHTGSTITMENNVVNNSYMLLRIASSAKNFTVEAHNNSILNSKATYHIKNESTSTINASNNYYDVTPTSDKFLGVSVWEPVLTEDPNE
ncbi:MAG: InlB B-repeat-containing protein [Bacilli bacterium]|nr:InlB B-repeat-containing protein [Bacilli bacterium]